MRCCVILGIALVCTINGRCNANLISNGDFELVTPSFTPPVDDTTVGDGIPDDWTVADRVLVWQEGAGHFGVVTIPDSGDAGELVINFGGPGSVAQVIDTMVGESYMLSYDLGGFNATSPVIAPEVDVLIDGSVVASHTIDIPAGVNMFADWMTHTLEFTATGTSTTIAFAGTNDVAGDDSGALLDNVNVRVPEPATEFLVVGLVLGGMVNLFRHRRSLRDAEAG